MFYYFFYYIELQRTLLEGYKKTVEIRLHPLAQSDYEHVDKMFIPVHLKIVFNNERLHTKSPEHVNELLHLLFLENKDIIKTVCLNGEEGMGKTIVCKKMISTWRKTLLGIQSSEERTFTSDTPDNPCPRDGDERVREIKTKWSKVDSTLAEIMKRFSYVFYVSLRYLKQETTVEDMIINQLLEGKLTDEFDEVVKTQPDNCLYILAGLDEWTNPEQGQGGSPLPKRKYNCSTFVTTRPWKMTEVANHPKLYNVEIKMTGIDEELFKSFGIKYKQVTENKSNTALSHAKSYQNCPMLCRFVLSVEERENKAYTSLTELYAAIIEWNLVCLDTVHPCDDKNAISSDTSCESFPAFLLDRPVYKRHAPFVQKLAMFCFDFLGKKLEFTDEKLKADYCMNDVEIECCHGLGVRCSRFKENESISGIHRSFQEFFAAIHLATSPQNKLYELFNNHICDAELNMDPVAYVLIFLCGFDSRNLKLGEQIIEEIGNHRNEKRSLNVHIRRMKHKQTIMKRCMKEAQNAESELVIRKVCLSSDSDILDELSPDLISVMAIRTDILNDKEKLLKCTNLRAIYIDKLVEDFGTRDKTPATERKNQRDQILNTFIRVQLCLRTISLIDIKLERSCLVKLLCGLETLEHAEFQDVRCEGECTNARNEMLYLKRLKVHNSFGIVDSIVAAHRLELLKLTMLPKTEYVKYKHLDSSSRVNMRVFWTNEDLSEEEEFFGNDEGFDEELFEGKSIHHFNT